MNLSVMCLNKDLYIRGKLLYLIAPILLAGCMAAPRPLYEGEKRPAHQVAIITNSSVIVTSIDGKEGGPSDFHPVEVLPGEHKLGVKFGIETVGNRTTTGVGELFVYFEAEAGKSYFVRSEMEGGRWWPLVIERPDLNVVSYTKSKK